MMTVISHDGCVPVEQWSPHRTHRHEGVKGSWLFPSEVRESDKTRWRTCAGCGEKIIPGQVVGVTVQAAQHVITVPAHDEHRASAHANTLERDDWKRNPSYYAGP
jgi:hypothetical protein